MGKYIMKLAAGEMFRNVANQAGIELQELNSFAKQPGNTVRKLMRISPNPEFFSSLSDDILDKSIDNFIDNYILMHIEMLRAKYKNSFVVTFSGDPVAGKSSTMKGLLEIYGQEGFNIGAPEEGEEVDEFIIFVDSRIAGLLMNKQGKENMAIRLSIQPEIAAERLVKDLDNRKGELDATGKTEEEIYNIALERTIERTANERERFIKIYSDDIEDQVENAKVDLQNLDNYNLVINTSGVSKARVVKVVHDCIEKARRGEKYPNFWRSTKYIYPGSVIKEEVDPSKEPKIGAIKVDGQYYALHGQEYVGIGNHNGYLREQSLGDEDGYPLIPVDLLAKRKQFVFAPNTEGNMKGTPADLYVQRNITADLVRNFEHDYGFKYPERGVKKLKSVEEVRDSSNKIGRRGSGPEFN